MKEDKNLNYLYKFWILIFMMSFLVHCQENRVVGRRLDSSSSTTSTTLQRLLITDSNGNKISSSQISLAVGETQTFKAALFTLSGVKVSDATVHWNLKILSGSINTLSCGADLLSQCSFTPTSPGSYTIEATLLQRTEAVVSFNDTTQPIVVTAPNTPSQLILKSGGDQIGVVDTQLTSPIRLSLLDSFNRPVVGGSVNLTVLAGGGSILSSNPHISDSLGEVAIQFKLGTTSGVLNQILKAEVVGANPSLSLNVMASAFPGPAHHLKFTQAPMASYAMIPWPTQPSLILQDQFDNITQSNESITASVLVGTGTLTGTTVRNFLGGAVSFTDLVYSAVEDDVQFKFTTAGGIDISTSTLLDFALPSGVGGITPDPVTFFSSVTHLSGPAGRTSSNSVTITGITQPIGVIVSGSGSPKLRLNGSGESSSLTNVPANSTIQITADPPLVSGSSHLITVVMGGRTVTWELRYVDPNRVAYAFVTSTTTSAGVGGLSGADNYCQTKANAAGYGGTWIAMVTSTSETLKTRIPWDWGQLRRLDGAIIATSWNDLWDGSLISPINVDENKNTKNVNVWTGSDSATTGAPTSSGSVCTNFTNGDIFDSTVAGSSSSTGPSWINSVTNNCGLNPSAFYCISQPSSAPDNTPKSVLFTDLIVYSPTTRQTSSQVTVAGITQTVTASVSSTQGQAKIKVNNGPEVTSATVYNGDFIVITMEAPTVAGITNTATLNLGTISADWHLSFADSTNEAIIFVTGTDQNGGSFGGIAGAHNHCQTLATAQGYGGIWKALLATDGGNGGLQQTTPWNWGTLKRMDGVIVATSWTDLWDGTIQNPISITETGQVKSTNVRSGVISSDGTGTTDGYSQACYNWGLGGGGYSTFGTSTSTNSQWISNGSSVIVCNTPLSIYCISDPNGAADSTPNSVVFLKDVSYVSGARVTSNSITLSGITKPVTVAVSGPSGNPKIKINGGSEVTTGTASWGQTIEIVMDAPSTPGQTYTATVGAGTSTWTWDLGYGDSAQIARIFVTNATFEAGTLGALSGADTKCNQVATDAGLTGTTWKAFLSDSVTNARNRIPFNWGTLKLMDGTVVANSWADLWDGTIQNPINLNASSVLTIQPVYSHTLTNGLIASAGNHCADWTQSYSYWNIHMGLSSSTASSWINDNGASTGVRCSGGYGLASLYCIEQK